MWFDSHCHLHLVEEESSLDDAVTAARGAGVSGIVAIGIDVPSSRRALDIATEYSLWSSAGVHPNSANEWTPEARGVMEELLADGRVVAVGETGLDNYWDTVDPAVQEAAFRDHIDMAKAFNKSLVIHTRRSTTQALDVLEGMGPPEKLVFHCWQGKIPEMERALDLGAYVSFAGNSWSKKAVRRAPAGRYMVETDSPYLTPEPRRGERNQPAFVVHVGSAIAEAREEDVETVARDTTAAAHSFFGISD